MKTGGLADVAGALPDALRAAGVDAWLMLPGCPSVIDAVRPRTIAKDLELLPGAAKATIVQARVPGRETPLYAVHCQALHDRPGGPDIPANARALAGPMERAPPGESGG